jgi:drug/metabolite transporter (DMT)-like permease
MKPEIEIQVPSGQSRAQYPHWVYHIEILISALFFALSTLLAKFAQQDGVTASMITFLRFAVGLVILSVYMAIARTKMEPRNPIVLILRGVFNLLAVFLFYYAIKYTTITNANLLNLTYPVFVALLSPIFLREYLSFRHWVILGFAGIGIWLIVNPNFSHVNIGDLIGLSGGFTAGLAIIMLCFARQSNHTATVLFFMFVVGTLLSWPAVWGVSFTQYSLRTWWILLACGVTGVIGQFAITAGFKYLSAVAGSITGMSRVVIAAILGFMFLAEVPTWNVVAGSIVLFFAIAWLALLKQNNPTIMKK